MFPATKLELEIDLALALELASLSLQQQNSIKAKPKHSEQRYCKEDEQQQQSETAMKRKKSEQRYCKEDIIRMCAQLQAVLHLCVTCSFTRDSNRSVILSFLIE